jgi:hypothetical protein
MISRKIVNGTDKAEKIGWYAIAFEKALRAAKWSAPAPVAPLPPVEPSPRRLSSRPARLSAIALSQAFACQHFS